MNHRTTTRLQHPDYTLIDAFLGHVVMLVPEVLQMLGPHAAALLPPHHRTCILTFQPSYQYITAATISRCPPQASCRHYPSQITTPKMYEFPRPHLLPTATLTCQSRYLIPRLPRTLHASLIASYNRLSKSFFPSDTKSTRKRSGFRNEMRKPWRRHEDALPLCPDCGAMTFAEWEKRSCLSSFEIHRHQKQTLPEKAGTHDV